MFSLNVMSFVLLPLNPAIDSVEICASEIEDPQKSIKYITLFTLSFLIWSGFAKCLTFAAELITVVTSLFSWS